MPQSDVLIRKYLVEFLKGGLAHGTFDDMVKDFPMSKINVVAPNTTYTPWRLLEHIRLTQWDILDYIRNPNYQEMEWPKQYWPPENNRATREEWQKTIKDYKRDMKELIRIVEDQKTGLSAKTPQKNGMPILREIIMVIDHNSHHLGEFGILRAVMKTWPR